MLYSLRAQGYKSFRSSVDIPLSKITILIGKNNSGKTAAARLPMLIWGAAWPDRRPGASAIPLRIESLDFASTVRELIFAQEPHGQFSLGATFGSENDRSSLEFGVHARQTIQRRDTGFISFFEGTGVDRIEWAPESSTTDIAYRPPVESFDGIWPVGSPDQKSVDRLNTEAKVVFHEIAHLASVRAPLLPLYQMREWQDSLRPDGSEYPFMLLDSLDLEAKIASWYEQELGIPGLAVRSDSDSFSLTVGPSQQNVIRTGQGAQQVFPVVALLNALALRTVRPTIAVIEEPELHLHPASHPALADLLVDASKSGTAQVIVETHSENLILRLRRRVAEGVLDPADLSVVWFDYDRGETKVLPIDVGADGSVSDWPVGVFSEDLEEVRAMLNPLI